MTKNMIENTELQKKVRLERVARLHRDGKTENEIINIIASEFDIDYNVDMFRDDLQENLALFEKLKNQDTSTLQMNEYYKRQDLIDSAREMLQKSMQPQVTRTVQTIKRKGEVVEERITVTETEKHGNLTLLNFIDCLMREQADILRLNQKFDETERERAMLKGNTQIEDTRALIDSLRPQNIENAEVVNDDDDETPTPQIDDVDFEDDEDDDAAYKPEHDIEDFM